MGGWPVRVLSLVAQRIVPILRAPWWPLAHKGRRARVGLGHLCPELRATRIIVERAMHQCPAREGLVDLLAGDRAGSIGGEERQLPALCGEACC